MRFAWSEVYGSLGAKSAVRLEQSLRFAWSNELALVSAFRRATSGRTRGQTRLAWFKWFKPPQTDSPWLRECTIKQVLLTVSCLLARHGETWHHDNLAPVTVFQISAKHIPPIFAMIRSERQFRDGSCNQQHTGFVRRSGDALCSHGRRECPQSRLHRLFRRARSMAQFRGVKRQPHQGTQGIW